MTSKSNDQALAKRVRELEQKLSEFKKIETSLKDSQTLLHTTIENLPFDFFAIDENDRYFLQNSVCMERWGNLIGLRPKEVQLDQEVVRVWLDNNRRAFSGETVREEVQYVRDGQKGFYYNIISPIKDGQRVIGILGINLDITDLKQVEMALLESEEKYRTLFENAPIGIGIADELGSIVMFNDHMLKPGGYTRDDLQGIKDLNQLYYIPEQRKKILKRIKTKGFIDKVEVKFKRRDGRPYDALLSVRKITIEGKSYLQATVQDISAQKDLEQKLRKSQERYRALVETTSDWIWEVDKNATYTYCSPKIKDILGYTPVEVAGKTPFDFMPRHEAKRISGLFKEFADGRMAFSGLVNVNLHKDGHEVVLETSGVPVFDEKGDWIAYRGIDRDITKRKKVEDALEKLNKELEKRVENRTAELVRANERLQEEIYRRSQVEIELRTKTRDLEELNSALKVLLRKRDEDREEIEEKIGSNVNELIFPYIERLKKTNLGNRQRSFIKILETNLDDIISPFARNLSNKLLKLTPSEIQVAKLIKQGKTSKEIAKLNNLSARTVEFHRDNIRKKLGIRNRKVNLRTHLLSLG